MTNAADVSLEPSGEPSSVAVEGSSGPTGPMLFRAAGTITDVRFPEREIEVIAHPYNEEAIVPWSDGRIVSEVCEPGAYDGIQRRAERIYICRDHNRERTVGKTMSLHPERDEGLVARMRMSKTALAEETLELAADGVLHASVAYKPLPGGEKWSRDRRQVRLTRCWLYHIALVPEPAYDGANVLAVRGPTMASDIAAHVVAAMTPPPEPVSTPYLDEVRDWLDSLTYSSRTK